MLKSLQLSEIDTPKKNRIRTHYDSLASKRGRFIEKNRYYHSQLIKYFKFIIPSDSKVLEIGCGDGFLLRELNPGAGIGLDFSPEMIRIACEKSLEYPNLKFITADIESTVFEEKFDYIIISDVLGNLLDIQKALENCLSACTSGTRIVLNFHSILWEPVLKLGEIFGIKLPQPHHNWLSRSDIENFLTLSGYELVKHERRMIFPVYVPFITPLLNSFFAHLPFVNDMCLVNFYVGRPVFPVRKEYSVSVVIPCRNESGNIRNAVARIPEFGKDQEIIFVDGHSKDGTVAEIEKTINEFKDKKIRYYVQPDKGKAQAVRLGFSKANGDILMILDADLTVPPENLARFYDAIAENIGELIIGSRLVYPMEKQAMRFLNIIGNRMFSLLFSWLLNQKIKDTLCGTKVILRTNYKKLEKDKEYFGDFDPFGDFELIFGAAKRNLKLLEIPIRYRERTYGETNIRRIAHGYLLFKMFFFALKKLKLQ